MILTINGVSLPSEAIEREAQRYAHAPDTDAGHDARSQCAPVVPGARAGLEALMQYIRVLAGRADIEGVDLDAAALPLLQ
jgi:hypothetical protein